MSDGKPWYADHVNPAEPSEPVPVESGEAVPVILEEAGAAIGRGHHAGAVPGDRRLYLQDAHFEPAVNLEDHRLHCHEMNPGADFYHRIAVGELFLRREDVTYCLQCAIRRDLLTAVRPTLASGAKFLDHKPRED
jgi:hypothetical protein